MTHHKDDANAANKTARTRVKTLTSATRGWAYRLAARASAAGSERPDARHPARAAAREVAGRVG